jgi:ubiquinol oxidase
LFSLWQPQRTEEAHAAYTDYLRAIDSGKIKNRPAPKIAIDYYRLPSDADLRDVVLHVRADEAAHREFNHMLANKYRSGDLSSQPIEMMYKRSPGDLARERLAEHSHHE